PGPVFLRPGRNGAAVDIDVQSVIGSVAQRSPPSSRWDHLHERPSHHLGGLVTALDPGAFRRSQPDAVLVLSEPDHVMAPVERSRVLVVLHGDGSTGEHGASISPASCLSGRPSTLGVWKRSCPAIWTSTAPSMSPTWAARGSPSSVSTCWAGRSRAGSRPPPAGA